MKGTHLCKTKQRPNYKTTRKRIYLWFMLIHIIDLLWILSPGLDSKFIVWFGLISIFHGRNLGGKVWLHAHFLRKASQHGAVHWEETHGIGGIHSKVGGYLFILIHFMVFCFNMVRLSEHCSMFIGTYYSLYCFTCLLICLALWTSHYGGTGECNSTNKAYLSGRLYLVLDWTSASHYLRTILEKIQLH